jgi:hypothetical protein
MATVLASALWAQQIGAGRTILATVVDSAGRPQVDLGLDDFVVSEDGDDREVLDVHIADYPVALLIDDKLGSAAIPAIKAAASRFVTRIGERPVVVGTLSSPESLKALEEDRAQVLRHIDDLSAGVSTGNSALAAVAAAAKLLKDAGAPFSAIVIVAAGPIDATELVRGDVLPAILESGATVDVVAGRSTGAADTPDASPQDLLRVLSDQTHGQYTTIFSSASYGIALDRFADRLATQLMVSYLVPPNSTAGDVKVGVRRPGARVQGMGVR